MTTGVFALGGLVEIAAGHPIRDGVERLAAGDTGIVQMRNIDVYEGIDWASVARVELPPARKIEFLRPFDVILSTRGARNSAVVVGELPFPCVCSPHFFILRADGGLLEPHFLAWQINQAPAQEYFQREATGSYILNIRREVVERLEVVVPPLARQAAIVAFARDAVQERRLLSALIDSRQQQMSMLAAGLRQKIKE